MSSTCTARRTRVEIELIMSDNVCPPPPPPPVSLGAKTKTLAPTAFVGDELQEACQRHGIDLSRHHARLRRVTPLLQDGPTCGPVALAMLLKCSPEVLVAQAREQGITNNGEVFSCRSMELLAREAARKRSLSFDFTLHSGNLCCESVVEALLDGAALLVPYDSDFNHAPCLRRGHKAHWALIVGILTENSEGDRRNFENVSVLARHGKSAHLAVWKLSDLAASNANLTEFPPHRECDSLVYVVPAGGVGGENGLRSQYIIARGL